MVRGDRRLLQMNDRQKIRQPILPATFQRMRGSNVSRLSVSLSTVRGHTVGLHIEKVHAVTSDPPPHLYRGAAYSDHPLYGGIYTVPLQSCVFTDHLDYLRNIFINVSPKKLRHS